MKDKSETKLESLVSDINLEGHLIGINLKLSYELPLLINKYHINKFKAWYNFKKLNPEEINIKNIEYIQSLRDILYN